MFTPTVVEVMRVSAHRSDADENPNAVQKWNSYAPERVRSAPRQMSAAPTRIPRETVHRSPAADC
jgi:hypothetical protein